MRFQEVETSTGLHKSRGETTLSYFKKKISNWEKPKSLFASFYTHLLLIWGFLLQQFLRRLKHNILTVNYLCSAADKSSATEGINPQNTEGPLSRV
jgi:hypothetical protein